MAGLNTYSVTLGPFDEAAHSVEFFFKCQCAPVCHCAPDDLCCDERRYTVCIEGMSKPLFTIKPTPDRDRPGFMSKVSIWIPLKNRSFRTLWIASLLSGSAVSAYDMAATWLMNTMTPSPLLLSLMSTFATLPFFIFALPAGVLADMFGVCLRKATSEVPAGSRVRNALRAQPIEEGLIIARSPSLLTIRWIAPMPPQLTALAFSAIS